MCCEISLLNMIAIEFEDYVGRKVIVALPDNLAIAFGGHRDVICIELLALKQRAPRTNVVIPQFDYLEHCCC